MNNITRKINLYLLRHGFWKVVAKQKELTKNFVTSSEIKSCIYFFYQNEELNKNLTSLISLGIRSIKVPLHKMYSKNIVVTISLDRPGVLIGKAGENIKSLENFVSKLCNKNIKFSVKDSKFWD